MRFMEPLSFGCGCGIRLLPVPLIKLASLNIGSQAQTTALFASIRSTHSLKADICNAANCALFDHLVGEGEQLVGNLEAERLRSLD